MKEQPEHGGGSDEKVYSLPNDQIEIHLRIKHRKDIKGRARIDCPHELFLNGQYVKKGGNKDGLAIFAIFHAQVMV